LGGAQKKKTQKSALLDLSRFGNLRKREQRKLAEERLRRERRKGLPRSGVIAEESRKKGKSKPKR